MTHNPPVSYERLQVIFDEMFNQGRVCDEETMIQYIRDSNYPEKQYPDLERVVHQFIDETYNG